MAVKYRETKAPTGCALAKARVRGASATEVPLLVAPGGDEVSGVGTDDDGAREAGPDEVGAGEVGASEELAADWVGGCCDEPMPRR
jgi:hypothetical protein